MKRDTKILIGDILENIDLIEKSTNKIKKEGFLKNKMLPLVVPILRYTQII